MLLRVKEEKNLNKTSFYLHKSVFKYKHFSGIEDYYYRYGKLIINNEQVILKVLELKNMRTGMLKLVQTEDSAVRVNLYKILYNGNIYFVESEDFEEI